MKGNKMISIDEDLLARLRLESNASSLIESLLTAYYGAKADPKAMKAEIMRLEAQKQAAEGDLQAIEAKEAEAKKTAAAEIEVKPKAEMDPAKKKAIQRQAFDGWDFPKEHADKMFEAFYSELESGMSKNLIEYCKRYNIKKKEKSK